MVEMLELALSRFRDVSRNVSEGIVVGPHCSLEVGDDTDDDDGVSINSLKFTPLIPMGKLHPSKYMVSGTQLLNVRFDCCDNGRPRKRSHS